MCEGNGGSLLELLILWQPCDCNTRMIQIYSILVCWAVTKSMKALHTADEYFQGEVCSDRAHT